MIDQPVTLIDSSACDALYAGTREMTQPPAATPATWQQMQGAALMAETDPWWVTCSLFETGARQSDVAATQQPLSALAWVNPALDYFRGHFPGAPLLPGVVQLNWAIALANRAYAPGVFAGLARVKFKTPVLPGALLRFELTPATQKVHLTIVSKDGPHTQGQLLYRG